MNKPIAFGRCSKIFEVGKGLVLKLYDKGFADEKIQQEYDNIKLIATHTDLNIPKPLKMVKLNDQTGIYYQKISGTSLMDLFLINPLRYFTYGKIIAKLHRQVHQYQVNGLKTQIEVFSKLLKNTNRLNSNEKELLLNTLRLKKRFVLCHGDFHHGNIMVDSLGKYYILDWMDAFSGDYVLDVALTAVNASVSDAPKHIPHIYYYAYEFIKRVLKLDRRYLNLYGSIEPRAIRDNLLLASGIHLARFSGSNLASHRHYFEAILSSKT